MISIFTSDSQHPPKSRHESWDDVLSKPVYVILWPFLVFRFDKIGSMDLHTKGLEESFVYEISDLYLIGIQSSTLIY